MERAWHGRIALYQMYPQIKASDIPFGQDAVGDQFILRGNDVYHLSGETGELVALGCGLQDFLNAAQLHPVEYLGLHPLMQFFDEGCRLEPGQLLSVYPPFCTAEAEQGVSLRAIPAEQRIAFLADFAAQISGLADGKIISVMVDK